MFWVVPTPVSEALSATRGPSATDSQIPRVALQEIGREFGGRHHTTVLHSINKIDDMRRSDSALDCAIARLMKAVLAQS
jgi:Bacterial dnaA protein helix-turn-helix